MLSAQPKFTDLVSRVEAVLAAGGSVIDDASAWQLTEELLETTEAAQVQAERLAVSNERDPIISASGNRILIENPRPVYWGFETRSVSSSGTIFTLVRPAEYEWRASFPFYARSPTTTAHQDVVDAPYDVVLSRGTWLEEPLSRVNVEPLTRNIARLLPTEPYTAVLDVASSNPPTRPVAVNGSARFANVAARSHTITLGGVDPNCATNGGITRNVTVTGGQTTTVTFNITCH